MVKRYHIMKHTSAFYRLSQMFFAERLRPYHLGAGQQFFLDRISKMPGVSMAELAEIGTFDNGTATRAVKKLVEEGYIRMEADERDRRVKRLYLTGKGEPLVQPIAEMRLEWYLAVTEGLTEEEKAQVGELMGRMVANARRFLDRQPAGQQPADPDEGV